MVFRFLICFFSLINIEEICFGISFFDMIVGGYCFFCNKKFDVIFIYKNYVWDIDY